ncbi:MAG: hypothetical protein J6S92_13645 [Oscillospiraceae bacterium]|nr:hypothetical protein [Oscillospiraceae bacterium]
MKVHELIAELKKCPQDAIVMYDFENEFINDEDERLFGFERDPKPSEYHMSVDEVMIGWGTTKGFVYLRAELIIEEPCQHVVNAGTENPECDCYGINKCNFQEVDYNPDGKINVVICKRYQTGGLVNKFPEEGEKE